LNPKTCQVLPARELLINSLIVIPVKAGMKNQPEIPEFVVLRLTVPFSPAWASHFSFPPKEK